MPRKLWNLFVVYARKKTGEIIGSVSWSFLSEAKTVNDAFEELYEAGFACVRRDPVTKLVVPNGDLLVRISSGIL